ncbi:PPOX class F420-dependent oxidoreductase [Streptomyces amakusaensis]|uniref:Pyridoxamine 5'-phosphate oxidase family protein n=1 Tax=Streptomyces amakusaensis TaxID=67271 RepID=A0ABW0ATG7_9ACTN
MTISLDRNTREILDGKCFPSLATVGPDGSARTSVIWAHRDGDTVLFVVAKDGRKHRDILHNNRISMSVFALSDPYTSVEIRGTAEVTVEGAEKAAEELMMKYWGKVTPAGDTSILVRLTPTRMVHHPERA